jgi:hypothetical protein
MVTMAAPAAASEMCADLSQTAQSIMKARQNGHPITTVMEIMERSASNEVSARLFRKIVIQAYEEPNYATNKLKIMAITDLGDSVYLQCIRGAR